MLLNLILSEDRGVVMTSIVIIPVTTIVACAVTTIVKSTNKEKRGSNQLPLFLLIGLSCQLVGLLGL